MAHTVESAGEARSGGNSAAPFLRLFLLGRFEVVRGGTLLPGHAWRRRRPADLLALVAIAPGRTLAREDVLAALWPDKDAASGANNLHRALHDLRRILGGRWLDIERGRLSLREDVWTDVDAFERAAAGGTRARQAEAVSLYRGDLLPQASAPWLEARRRELRERFADVAVPLAREAAQAGDAATAVPLLRRILDVDPQREHVHRDLMRLLALTGRRAEALRAYDACEGALRAVGLAAGEETRTLRQSIQLGAIGPAQEPAALDGARRAARRLLGMADPPPVRGRNALLLVLEALVERGAGMLVLLGERGVGKTRLAIEGARFAQGQGAAVLAATATAWPGSPYGIFADLFRDERLGALRDPLAAAASPTEAGRLSIHRALTEELAALADGRPIFLLLDDLHAADESSLNLVHDLARSAPRLRLMIVATCRDDEVHAGRPIQTALAHLDVGGLARGLRLPRLTMAGAREQLADLLGAAPDEPLVSQVYRATDGSPFLVEEAARVHLESRQVPADPAVSLRARATRLGPAAERLLAAAAVVGRRFDFEVVQRVSGLPAHEASRVLEECQAARLVDEDGTGYLFRHDLVRQALYDGLPAALRATLHGAAAAALEATAAGADRPELLAHHLRLAGEDGRALDHLAAAGHRAASRACLAEALAFHAEALELAPRVGASAALRLDLLDAAGRVQLALGETAAAARSFGEVARLAGTAAPSGADPRGGEDSGAEPPAEAGRRARAQRLAAVALAASGDLGGAFAAIEQGLALAGDAADEERAALLHLSGQLHYHEGRAADVVAVARACREVARRTGDLDLDARGSDLEAIAGALAGDPVPAVDDAIRPADRRAQDIAPEHLVDVHLALWDRDLLGDRTCVELARGATAIAERARLRAAPEVVASGRYGEGVVALAAGLHDAAEALLRDARDGFRGAGSAMGEALALERLGTLLVQLGRFEEAAQLLSEGVVIAERGLLRRHVLTRLHVAEVRYRLAVRALGPADSAWREASECAARHGECLSCDAVLRPEAVRVALAFGRIDEAEGEARALEEVARQRGGRALQALARFTRARVQATRERPDDALVSLAQARAGFLGAGLRYEAARTARLEARLRGSLPDAWRELFALVRVEADA